MKENCIGDDSCYRENDRSLCKAATTMYVKRKLANLLDITIQYSLHAVVVGSTCDSKTIDARIPFLSPIAPRVMPLRLPLPLLAAVASTTLAEPRA